MVDAVETIAYAKSGGVPWHGMGFPVRDDMTPTQMLKAAKIDWTVSKQPIFVKLKDGNEFRIPDEYALIRDSDQSILTMVGSVYKPTQNAVAIDFFKKFVRAGGMKMETAGSLWNGRFVWALARVGSDFKLGKTDEMRNYLLLCSPHAHGKALVIDFTPIRVVCWNTLNFALGSSLKGSAGAFRMPHTMEFNDSVRARAEQALGLATKQAEEFKQAAQLLTKSKAKVEDVETFFCNVLQFDAAAREANKKKKDGTVREPNMLPKFRAALDNAPGQQLNTALGTWWGAVNAVTHVVDHEVGRDRQTALKTAWLGQKAELKRRAVNLALKAAA